MLRTRLLWFAIGFGVSSAAISQFVWRDLLGHRYALSSDMKRKFDDLEGRILNLESVPSHNSNPTQVFRVGNEVVLSWRLGPFGSAAWCYNVVFFYAKI